MFKIIVLTNLLAVVLSAQIQNNLNKISGRIVGGYDITIEKLPYQVSITYDDEHHCGGAIVGPKAILTAAHCVNGIDVKALKVRAGSTYRTHGGVVAKVKEAIPHPQFSERNADKDVGIILLYDDLLFNESIRPTVMASADTKFPAGSSGIVSGWGLIAEDGNYADTLQALTVPLIKRDICKDLYTDSALTEYMICAGDQTKGNGFCNSDSGGPLVINGILVGVVSWNADCGREGKPGVYANVGALRSWIDKIVKK